MEVRSEAAVAASHDSRNEEERAKSGGGVGIAALAEMREEVCVAVANRLWCTALDIAAGCVEARICAAEGLCAGMSERLPLPSAPQITSRMGKSFAQLLTSRAVLIAAGLAAVGGGRGWMFCSGAVDARRRGGAGRGGGPIDDVPCGGGERSVGEATSLYELGVGVGQSRLAE